MTKGFADELVEKVARALWFDAWEVSDDHPFATRPKHVRDAFRGRAITALAALDQNDRLALLQESLPEDKVAGVWTVQEIRWLSWMASAASESHALRSGVRAKLQALLSNSDPGERR